MNFTKNQITRLEKEKIIWIVTLNKDKPHLVPIWFQLWKEKLYCCTGENSIKIKNITNNPKVSISLENGTKPLVIEGIANIISRPFNQELVDLFNDKYDWNISTDQDYTQVIEIVPNKVLLG